MTLQKAIQEHTLNIFSYKLSASSLFRSIVSNASGPSDTIPRTMINEAQKIFFFFTVLVKLVIIQACDPFHFNYLLQEYDSPIKTDMIMVRIKVKQYLPVATGRTKTVAILIIGLWVNLDSSLEFRKLILWNFSTYLSSCFWSNRMYSSSRTT